MKEYRISAELIDKEDLFYPDILENIGLLDVDTIEKVNALVLEVGYGYLKKKTKKLLGSKPIVML